LSIFDLKNFIRWKEHNNFNIKFYKLNNPECLDPQYVPRQFRQAIWNQISHLDVPPIISEVLHQADNIVDLKLFEQYNYLTQYFSRVEIDPEQIPNELFVEYWTWLTQHINERFKR